MFGRVQQRAGKDWLPTPVRALAQVLIRLKAGDQAVAETFGSLAWAKGASDGERGILDGNVEGFKKHDQVWKDFEIQATGAVVYAGLENDFSIPRAREILCKVGSCVEGMSSGRVIHLLTEGHRARSKPMHSIGWIQTPG